MNFSYIIETFSSHFFCCNFLLFRFKGEKSLGGTIRLEKDSRWSAQHVESNDNKEAEAVKNENNGDRPPVNEGKHKRGKNIFSKMSLTDKVRFYFSFQCFPLLIYVCLLLAILFGQHTWERKQYDKL